MPPSAHYQPKPVFSSLGEAFSDVVAPAEFPETKLRYRNDRWAQRVGLDELDDNEWIAHFARFTPLDGNLEAPLSLRYHGHQFRAYNPHIGDGRGFLHAQLLDGEDGRLLDLTTKGSGRTPHSRTGDGKLTLLGGVREVLITSLLEALGVYTSKSFSLVETGEQLWRGDEPSPTRSSVLVRLGHSHVRFGSFERQAYLKNTDGIQALVDHAVAYYMPNLDNDDGEEQIAAFLREVCANTARLGASWMAAGFVHGVLNTDNVNITGESFDYGPYRMLPTYDPAYVAAYFDDSGLYAFGRQPEALFWNLQRLAGTLADLCDKDTLIKALQTFPPTFQAQLREKMMARLGLVSRGLEEDENFLDEVMRFLHVSRMGYEQFFFDWFCGAVSAPRAKASPSAKYYESDQFSDVRRMMDAFTPERPERLTHAYFSRAHPRTLLKPEIDAIWQDIAENDDWSAFERTLAEMAEMREALALSPL